MHLKISHTTSYHYDNPVPYALQQLRLRPKSRAEQNVISWDVTVDGGRLEASFEDEHANRVDLISFEPGAQDIVITCEGEVEVTDNNGVVGKHTGFTPLWLFDRTTKLTKPGPGLRALMSDFTRPESDLATLHGLSDHILSKVPYSKEQTSAMLTAEQALAEGHGVCQDHAHIFIAAARQLGHPARYVSGYLMMDEQVEQSASHAWAEAYVDGLGWVGFDVSNGQSPDARYVRVATGLDYSQAAPTSGMRFGEGPESMRVTLVVEQQQ
ncbi:transglutaminase family protein [Marinibacterium profundimaris]|uniref:Transglutaminase n=1 Tax=Marinibacterium profundimaris TaxID=1679460 RepID=A0A225NSY0_9RHOB|nr:transglutaminase family protein [Marinibacterium profundimaris]OWU75928.1 transglutaminase [Marinibacterium profundimaris]